MLSTIQASINPVDEGAEMSELKTLKNLNEPSLSQ